MPLKIVRNDITKMQVDAIVNPTNHTLLSDGGVDGAIHRAAGDKLRAACEKLGRLTVGEAKLTHGFELPAKYVIHTVGPVYRDGNHGEAAQLAACYRSALSLARKKRCKSVAFPLISSGVFGYPKDRALQVATDEIGAFLLENDMMVYLVVFDSDAYRISERLFTDVTAYIDDRYVERHRNRCASRRIIEEPMVGYGMPSARPQEAAFASIPCEEKGFPRGFSIELDESFSQMLLRKIDESGMTDAQCYKKANVDRKLFSKIRGDVHYKPSKPTAIAFAIALELSLPETEEMLKKAGFALSHSNKFDIIIEYAIQNGIYDIYRINEILFAFDQSLLGA